MVRPARRRSRIAGRIRRTTWRGWFSMVLVLALGAAVAAWAHDAHTLKGRIPRNVTVAGVDIGRRSPRSTNEALTKAAAVYSHTEIELVNNGKVTRLSAAEVGLHLDPAATIAAAKSVGAHDNEFAKPVLWLASFLRPRPAPVRVSVDMNRLALALAALPGQVPVHEPTVTGSPYAVGVSAGRAGRGYVAADVARGLQRAATLGALPIRVELVARTVPPTYSDYDASLLAIQAEQLTAKPIKLVTADTTVAAGPAQLRTWITSVVGPKGLELAMDGPVVREAAEQLLGRVQHPSADAAWTVVNDQVVLIPQRNGTRCCAATSGAAILAALRAKQPSVNMPLIQTPPPFTTAKAKQLGITTKIGINTSWDGITDNKEFSIAFNGAVAANVANAANVLRGRVLEPHGVLSLNQLYGPPIPQNGFSSAPEPTPDGPTYLSGGGADYVATALFNAAFFGGLDIVSSTPHGVMIPGLPPGREANLGWSQPDLVIRNPSPFGVLIWTKVSGGIVTVTLYSSPYATGAQTGQVTLHTGPQNLCTRIVTQRTRTFTNGQTASDSFSALYAPTPLSRTDPKRITC